MTGWWLLEASPGSKPKEEEGLTAREVNGCCGHNIPDYGQKVRKPAVLGQFMGRTKCKRFMLGEAAILGQSIGWHNRSSLDLEKLEKEAP